MAEPNETNITEITIQPDGRVYVFGLSRPVLEVLATLPAVDPWPRRLLEQLPPTNQTPEMSTRRAAEERA